MEMNEVEGNGGGKPACLSKNLLPRIGEIFLHLHFVVSYLDINLSYLDINLR